MYYNIYYYDIVIRNNIVSRSFGRYLKRQNNRHHDINNNIILTIITEDRGINQLPAVRLVRLIILRQSVYYCCN